MGGQSIRNMSMLVANQVFTTKEDLMCFYPQAAIKPNSGFSLRPIVGDAFACSLAMSQSDE